MLPPTVRRIAGEIQINTLRMVALLDFLKESPQHTAGQLLCQCKNWLTDCGRYFQYLFLCRIYARLIEKCPASREALLTFF